MLAKTLGAAFGLLAFCSAALAQGQAVDDNPIVAIVNGAEIHRADVEAVARSLPDQMRQMPMAQIYPMLLDRVIDFKLLSVEAENQKLGDDPDLQRQEESGSEHERPPAGETAGELARR